MPDVVIKAVAGGEVALPAATIDTLDASLRGSLVRPDSASYDEARTIWNAMIDRRPGLIVRCAGTSDVIQAVSFAREHGLLLSVRGAGHNIAGKALRDGAMLVDLSGMRAIRVDAAAQTARIEPGCTLGDVDHETAAFGLALPTGINSTTGISGLTLGGGFGWLSRKYGMTIDSLISADVVTAQGNLVKASADENADLFWGIRGGRRQPGNRHLLGVQAARGGSQPPLRHCCLPIRRREGRSHPLPGTDRCGTRRADVLGGPAPRATTPLPA